mmetsp:Transcript_11743/g.27133  ORF Transcript_11743/g.27133 Transcript_11743/m.27133 type:complete len:202 (+) Transcript_11743:1676-2281(+)
MCTTAPRRKRLPSLLRLAAACASRRGHCLSSTSLSRACPGLRASLCATRSCANSSQWCSTRRTSRARRRFLLRRATPVALLSRAWRCSLSRDASSARSGQSAPRRAARSYRRLLCAYSPRILVTCRASRRYLQGDCNKTFPRPTRLRAGWMFSVVDGASLTVSLEKIAVQIRLQVLQLDWYVEYCETWESERYDSGRLLRL